MPTTTWDTPKPLGLLKAAFPTTIIGTLLPERADIPDTFFRAGNPWNKLASELFFVGGELPPCKPGIDAAAAKMQIVACLRSFEPSHEHKEAGVAYLLSLWHTNATEAAAKDA